MRIEVSKLGKKSKNRKGFAIALVLIVLVIVLIIGMAAATLGSRNLSFVNKDKYNTRAFYAAEAGMARAMAKLKENPAWTGWVEPDGKPKAPEFQEVKMPYSDDVYTVYVYNNFSPVPGAGDVIGFRGVTVPPGYSYIVGEGKVGTGVNQKAVKHVVSMVKRTSPFSQFGLFGDNEVQFNGNISVKAYDSNTGAAVAKKADVGTNGNQVGAFTSKGSAAYVDGKVYTGPGSTSDTVSISGHPTITGGNPDILPNKIPMPEVQIPSGLPKKSLPAEISFSPQPLFIANLDSFQENPRYKFLMTSRAKGGNSDNGGSSDGVELAPGDYSSDTGSNDVNIRAKQTIILKGPGDYVFDNINIASQGQINVDASSGPVRIFMKGDIVMTGGGTSGAFFNSSTNPKPSGLRIYGTKTCKNIDMAGNSEAYMTIYAPDADLNMRGNSDLWGAMMTKNIWIHGNPGFTYDVRLNEEIDDIVTIQTVSWQRL